MSLRAVEPGAELAFLPARQPRDLARVVRGLLDERQGLQHRVVHVRRDLGALLRSDPLAPLVTQVSGHAQPERRGQDGQPGDDKDREHQPLPGGAQLGVGEATLDLSQLPAEGTHLVVHSKVSLGHLIVIVPDGVPIRLHAKLRVGDITEFGTSLVSGSSTIERTRTYGPSGDPRVEVEATMGTGQIEVRHG